MSKKIFWLMVCGLIVLLLVIAACGPAATPTTPTTPATPTTPTKPVEEPTQKEAVKPTAEVPQYGGTINFASATDQLNWDPVRNITGILMGSIYQLAWEGDWAKGPAGGYGTNETDWGFANNDLHAFKDGRIAESWKWTIDAAKDEGTIVYQIRQGVRYHSVNSEAGRLVGGREVTADDVVYVYKRATTIGTDGFIWRGNTELRNAPITKTGPREVTIKLPVAAMTTGISRFGDALFFYPPEVVTKYGDMQKWQNAIGTGPFMLTDVVPGSIIKLDRHPNYWLKDPVGPGKGNQLPYIDGIRVLVIPDASTRYAALRTGKIDQMAPLDWEDAKQILKITPALQQKVGTSWQGRGTPLMMRTDKAPFNDIRVRKAMMLATDFQTILNGLYGGIGQIVTHPFSYVREYGDLYLGLDDPEFPASAKELYTYNPEKAKQFLKEAGYPNGFKTKLLLTSTATSDIDYYSIVKDMWAKVGIELEFDLKETAAASAIRNSRTHEALATSTTGPVAVFYVGNPVQGQSAFNLSMIDDPVINQAMVKVRLAAITDQKESMRLFKEMSKYAVQQAYAIPNVIGRYVNLWWPWIKNYSGEITVGYDDHTWPQFIWYDQALKKSMGY